MPNKLSVCMIIKNEAKNIADAVQSVQAVADEIVVVDTGSTDDSVAIAQKHGCVIGYFPWVNDFSAARNESILLATGDWILWFDADDRLCQESVRSLNSLKNAPLNCVYSMIVQNQKPDNTGSQFMQARLFPRCKEIKFEGAIHEQIMPSAFRAGLQLVETDIRIYHLGYSTTEEMKKKAKRNIDLLLKMVEPKGADAVTSIEIADSYFILEEYDSAYKWYYRCLDIENIEETQRVLASQAYRGLATIANNNSEFYNAIKFFKKAETLCPERTDIVFGMAMSYFRLLDYESAVLYLKKIFSYPHITLQVGVDYRLTEIKAALKLLQIFWVYRSPLEMEEFAHFAAQTFADRAEIQTYCGISFLKLDKHMEALHCFERSLQLNSSHIVEAICGLCTIYQLFNRLDLCATTIRNYAPVLKNETMFLAMLHLFSFKNLMEELQIKPLIEDAKVKAMEEFRKIYLMRI